LSQTRLLWEGKEGERGVSCHEKLWGQLLRERKKGACDGEEEGRKKRKKRKKRITWFQFHGFTLCLFVSATKILCSAGAKSARVGDLGFSSVSDFICVPLPLVKERE